MNIDFSLTYNPKEEYNEIGYHTTFVMYKESIIKNGFYKSTKENEWLGEGVYFWDNEVNALWWKSKSKSFKKCIFICKLKCCISKYLDLDNEMGKFETFSHKYLKTISSDNGKKPCFKNADECRKFFCDAYCSKNDICILAYTFDHDIVCRYGFKIGTVKRRQICVRDPACISIVDIKE